MVDRNIPCSVCRQRKIGCDRQRPKCGLCRKNNFDCRYVHRERRPGLRAGYVTQLEHRLASLEDRVLKLESGDGPPLPDAGPAALEMRDSTENDNIIDMQDDSITQSDDDENRFDYGDEAAAKSVDQGPASNGTVATSEYPAAGVTAVLPSEADALSGPVASELCNTWFERYHPWFPILHQPSVMEAIQSSWDPKSSRRPLVLRAIVAATIRHDQLLPSTPEQRQNLSAQLSRFVLTEAMGTLSLDSVQALLILSVLHYGDGDILTSWNGLSICRRMNAHLGLRDAVANHHSPGKSSPALPRLQPLSSSSTTIDKEERVRAYWMTEMLDSVSVLGASYDVGLSQPPPNPALPCSDSLWAYPEEIINVFPMGQFHYSSAFSLCIILAVSELAKVHRFLQKPVNMEDFNERDAWQSEAQRIDERLALWREDFVAAVFRLINAEYSIQPPRAEMEPYIVLTNCVLNTAVIALLQQRAPCPEEIDKVAEPWAFASNRCVYACENMAYKVRQMYDEELFVCHPHLIFSIFVAARFYIVHAKALDADVPSNLHSLAFALHNCRNRWPLARVYETVIRTAVAEHRTPVSSLSLPRQFYELRYSTLEITPSLQEWAEAFSDRSP